VVLKDTKLNVIASRRVQRQTVEVEVRFCI
jgi:hypothetical protein